MHGRGEQSTTLIEPEEHLRRLVMASVRDPTALARALRQVEDLVLSDDTIAKVNGFTRDLVAHLRQNRTLCRLSISEAAGTRGLLLVTAVRRVPDL